MKPLIYYAHSAQDELANLLPYEHWQTLQSHSVNVGEMAAEFAQVFGVQKIACQPFSRSCYCRSQNCKNACFRVGSKV